MFPLDGDRRALELMAYQALWNLWRTAQRRVIDADNWDSACAMLERHYSVAKAREDSEACAMRIRYLEIAEPWPQLADFVAKPPGYRVADAPRQLAQVRYNFYLARQRHSAREQQRQKELETTRALYKAVKATEVRTAAAETARRREWQASRWPQGVVLESDIYNLDSVADQVQLQNLKIESEVIALNDLLRDGLRKFQDCQASDHPEAEVASHVVSVLRAMPLPRRIKPGARSATFSAESRQLVVEFELPCVEVVPEVKSYRYVKSREVVVASARPAWQVKILYANIIAQIALLTLWSIFESDVERHVDVVVFNGIVDTVEPSSGEPVRPCLLAVRATRDAFAELALTDADASACLRHLSARVSHNPTKLVPVQPLPE